MTRKVPSPPSRLEHICFFKHTKKLPFVNNLSRGILRKELNYQIISMVVEEEPWTVTQETGSVLDVGQMTSPFWPSVIACGRGG